jgi:hypothetical protein
VKETEMTIFSTKDFSFDSETKTLSQEISTLSQGGRRKVFKQIYLDACDEGLTLVSAETGLELDFVVEKEDYSGHGEDRELAGWRMIPTRESLRKHAKHPLYNRMAALKMLIIND